jgi:hypothetical protein
VGSLFKGDFGIKIGTVAQNGKMLRYFSQTCDIHKFTAPGFLRHGYIKP